MPISSPRSRQHVRAGSIALVALGWALGAAAATPAMPAGEVAPAEAASPAASSPAAVGPQEAFVAVVVNGAPVPTTLMLTPADGRILVRSADLVRWRFVLPSAPRVVHEGDEFTGLDAIAGLRYRLDAPTQTLHIDTVAANFVGTVLGSDTARSSAAPPVSPGGYLNYDVSVESAERRTSAAGLFEAVAFGRWGTVSSGAVARSGRQDGGFDGAHRRALVRLDTTWTLDRPAERASWRGGDVISRGGSSGQPARLGGVQYATNFATQPGFVTFPLPSFAGEAALPSTVDLYVNDALRMRREVPAGPFSVPELPVVTGSGEVRVVVRDLLGRQQTIVAPFYASAQLLASGLRDFSYELGALRANFGRSSTDYRQLVAVGTERRGLSENLTGELHAEVARERQALGLGADWLLASAGVFSAAAAVSRSSAGDGALVSLGFQRQAARFNFGANIAATSEGYRPLGVEGAALAPRGVIQAYATYPIDGYGSLGINYVRQELRHRQNVELLGASFGVSLGRAGYLSFTLLHDLRSGQASAGLNFSTALDANTSFNASANAQGTSRSVQVQAQRGLPVGDGIGYRVMALGGDTSRAEGNLMLQNDHGRLELDAAVSKAGRAALRIGAAGGVAVLGGYLFASRAISESFAVVEVPGFPGVRVYAANQLVGTTGADGSALAPRLLPYQKNAIRIEQADLPLDATVDALGVDVAPGLRSGVLLPFPIRRSRGGVITVVLDDGAAVPVGAVATLAGSQAAFPAAQLGEFYLTGLDADNIVRLAWRGQRCEISVAFAKTDDPLPHLGTFTCHGVKR
jgi:outer membrane usher protein